MPYAISYLFFCFLLLLPLQAQDTLRLNKKRLHWVIGASSTAYVGSLIFLHEAWYKNNPRTAFHFFNDNPQWRQIDKIGHAYSAFHISRASTELYQWTGLSHKKAVLWGAITSQILMTPIEIFDGFSASYGASWGDALANFAGGLLWWFEHQIWQEPHLHFKFSFSTSGYASLRPNVLGKNLAEQILKDYNGQTYWLSVDFAYLTKIKKFPAWLNVAFGTGANEMIYAREPENNANGFQSYRRFFLGLDFHLANIPTKSRFLKKIFWTLGTIRLPAPALEYNLRHGFQWHWLYF
ncbi:MAG: YfiM family protein [Raineya sp.]|nr:YfiM family protein [Raineya sp.]